MTLLSCSSAYQGARLREPPQLATKHRGWELHMLQEAGVVKRSMVGFTAPNAALRSYWKLGIFILAVCKNYCDGTARWHIRLSICSPKNLTVLIGGSKCFSLPQPPPATFCPSTPMNSKHYRGSYNPDYGTLSFPPSYPDHRTFGRHPTYQNTPSDSTATPPTQLGYVWDVRNSLRQTPAQLPMVPFIDPMSPGELESDCSLVSAQPTGFYPIQSQVSLLAASIIESVCVMRSSTPGHHMPKRQHDPSLWKLGAQLKTGQIPELAATLPRENRCPKRPTR